MPVTYAYPNGKLFEMEKEWLIAAGIMLEEDSTKFGNKWKRGDDTHHAYTLPTHIGDGQEVIIEEIGNFAQPERPGKYRLLDGQRLIDILNAFRGRISLPVVTAEWGWTPSMNGRSGRGIIVRNGFHRFHASIIYGYSKLPVLIDKPVVTSSEKSTGSKYIPPHLRNKQ